MKKLFHKHRQHFTNREFLVTIFFASVLFVASLFINFYAGQFATKSASNAVTDIILSNIRVYDVDALFVYGFISLWFFVVWLCFLEPKRIPFILKSIALFIIIRSIFISLTHIGPFPTHLIIDSSLFNKFTFDGDLFFSAHVGLPFLMTLLFWKNFRLRLFFFACSLLFGAVVLMAHLHYTIDVLSAFFITYTIYHLAEILFKKDYKLFETGFNLK